MENELQDYIEELKSRKMDTENIRKTILKIKRNLDHLFDCCESEITEGELTKEQLVEEFLEEYQKELEEPEKYQTRITYLFSQYESCKKILKGTKKDKNGIQFYINEAKRRESNNPKEDLYNNLNMKEQIITTMRYAMRDIKYEKKAKGKPDANNVTFEELISKIHNIKNNLSEELKDKLIKSIQKRVYFLEEYGYIDEYIDSANDALKNSELPGIVQVKRNPLPDIEYDKNGNMIKTEEFEDMGVIDVFEKSNLKKYSPEDLLVLELFWKSQYFTERLEVSESLAAIKFLDLWPKIINEDESAIKNISEEDLSNSLKRDLALTYLIRNKNALTPEIEEKYVNFLTESKMKSKDTIFKEIEEQSSELKSIFHIANDIGVGECIVVDKLKNKELETKQWGVVDKEKFNNAERINDETILAIEMPAFRGPLIIALKEDSIKEFFEKKENISNPRNFKLPKYKGTIENEYSRVMSTLFLPTSTYFKKYVTEKYSENPTSPLFEQLAVDFAGAKKIKFGKKIAKKLEDRIK